LKSHKAIGVTGETREDKLLGKNEGRQKGGAFVSGNAELCLPDGTGSRMKRREIRWEEREADETDCCGKN